jgi:hypothetical protein
MSADDRAIRVCDDFGSDGFSWIVDEPMTRTSHALAADGDVWLVDAVDWPEAVERARTLGRPAGVIQLLDRHTRDCATLAGRLGVPHLVAPNAVPGSPFECVSVVRWRRWQERALWWPANSTLVVADALGTNAFYTGGRRSVGVHLFLRLTPPRALGSYDSERLLVGHGEAIRSEAGAAIRDALRRSRRDLPRVLVRLPFADRASPTRPRRRSRRGRGT